LLPFQKKFKEKPFTVLFILLICSYIVLSIQQIQELFVADEICFVKVAETIATTGMPIYTGANNNIQFGLWHPPLYANILGASFRLFGVHEWSARVISVIFTLGTFVVVYFLTKAISNNNNIITLLSCFLFLFNPLVMQGSLLIDIDNSILMFLMMIFIYTYLKVDRTKKTNLILLGVLFGITLWAKLPTPPILILGIFIFNSLNKNVKTGIMESLTIGSIGATLFLLTWLLYCKLLDLPFLYPFIHSFGYLNTGENSLHFLLTHLWGLKNIVFWATPFFILLVAIVFVKRVGRYLQTKQLEALDLLVVIGTLIFFEYLIVGSYQTQDFPRYFIPMMPVFSIVLANFIGGFGQEFNDNRFLISLTFLVLAIYFLFVLGDPLLVDRIIFNTVSIYEIVMETAQTFLFYMLPLGISYFLFKILKVKNAAILAIVISLIACSICLNITHSQADYSVGYFHGEKGMDKTIEYLKPRVNPNDSIIARADVAYALSVKNYYSLPNNPSEFDKLIDNKNIKYVAVNKGGYFTTLKHASVYERIDEVFELDAQFGDFRIYKNKKLSQQFL